MSKVDNYCRRLRELNIPKEALQEAQSIFQDVPELLSDLTNPSVALEHKTALIQRVFPTEVRDVLFVLCERGDLGLLPDIIAEYNLKYQEESGNEYALLRYVTPPTEQQLERIRHFLIQKYEQPNMEIITKEDPSLQSGFILRVGKEEYDWSESGRVDQLRRTIQNISEKYKGDSNQSIQGIVSILREEIDDFDLKAEHREIGLVQWVGDGIATITGIDHSEYGEILVFDGGVKGMVQDIRRDSIGCILFGDDRSITEGTRVIRTGKRAGIPVGHQFLGRVVDALGAPIDGKGMIQSEGYRPIENPAPSIVDRKSVSVPLETGILSIDSMFPIGRGQRELIIGDRQTGKTSIATDTIINQKDKDVICIYVAIGQKASTVAKIVNSLEKHGAMDYTIVVSASASDPAPLQYIAPYSGTALAEHFMYQGKDVLIIYDDLSKHAVAYRAISLLLERPPGREAYPGDVFYLHSRLLERSSRLTPEAGGGSITALPIIETQAGDVSAYIPTNVISITDGQIFLESDLFFSGMRPAVNVGLSVSRVGGAAQSKAMKKAAGSIRIDLAQYREMEVFTQFSSDLDDETKAQLSYGAALMELLKQPLASPMSMADEVITLVAASGKVFVGLPLTEVKAFQARLLAYMSEKHSELVSEITRARDLSDTLRDRLVKASKAFREEYDKEVKA